MFVILGAPRTKNRGAPIMRGGRLFLIPPKPYQKWMRVAKQQIPALRLQSGIRTPIEAPVVVTAVWYRDRATGDEDNFKKALGDFLQQGGFVKNDKFIHWGGDCRLDKDAKRPRVEVVIEEVAA